MIELQNVTKKFYHVTAVNDVTFTIPQSEVVGVLGPNGAGKTTTVRMLGAILRPTSGSAQINGYDVVQQADKVRHDIGMLTEQPGLYLRMSGLEYLLFYGRLYNLTDDEIKKRGLAMFDRFDMAGQADRRLGQYSKGMRQKVGLIRAMLHNPSVLLLDEPTSAMDPHSAKLVRDAIRELREDKRTVILCTHNLAEAEMLADSIAIIKKGTIVAQGSTAVLKQKLLGQPQLEVRVDKHLNGEIGEIEQLVTVEAVLGDKIRYRTDNPDVTNPQLVRRLGELGLGVISLQPVSQSLEQVYLRVVSDGASSTS